MAHCCDEHSPEKTMDHALARLRSHEMRVTEPRKAMLQILTREHGPFSAEELHQKMGGKGCDVVTVYRSLQAMEEIGVVRRCDFGDGTYRYEINHGEHHHHHIICRHCRSVQVLDHCIAGRLERAAREMGYENISHTLEIFGVCPACAKKARVA
jgi:Fur family transcriptional regulator, ferric uptake regulator